MQRPAKLVTISDWGGLIEAMRVRRAQLGLTQEEVNRRAGLQDGYYNKIEAWRSASGRGIGPKVFARILAVLGMRLQVVTREPYLQFEDMAGGVFDPRQKKKSDVQHGINGSGLTHAEKSKIYRRSMLDHPIMADGYRAKEKARKGDWRARNRERYNAYMREVMRRRREARRAAIAPS